MKTTEGACCLFIGPLQKQVYLIISLPIFFTAFTFFVDVFTLNVKYCGEDVKSKSLNHSVSDTNLSSITFTTRWTDNYSDPDSGPTCQEENQFPHGQASYMTGLLIGSLFGGTLSDKYGKRSLLICCSVVHAVTTLIVAFLPYVPMYLTARCISGVACCAIHICTYSLGVEWSLPKYRIWPPTLLSFIFSLGMMGLASVAYLTNGWMQFHLALGIPQILFLPLYLLVELTQISIHHKVCYIIGKSDFFIFLFAIVSFLPESPRWLLLNKRMQTLVGYKNRSPEDKHYLDILLDSMDNENPKSEKIYTGTESDFTNFTSPTILLRLFVMSYIGFASALTYYGICFSVGSFGVNIYLAQFFSGLSESPSLLLPFLLKRWGRRPFSMGSLFLSGISCMLSLLVSKFCDMPVLVMTLALMGKLCMQSTTCVSLLYGIELFPTVIRQKCVGLVSLCYRVACIINAVVVPEGEIPLPAMICYSSGPIIGAALCLLLPETSSIPLPDTVQDCERQPRLKLLCCARWPLKPIQELDDSFTKGKDIKNQMELSPLSA
ncbi:solute carrier family 22 member 6 isoform X2 [Myxocyprinus asiaticus]|uniref:solute carrier family 22 member 6 isoform X2 n=1 Tax=Myxocyprinus asiaticus TaxID=70543 RepID=UPI002221DF3F|nr:solute carrier family 22 member 6 isoform X2 [Myxocyprinus asiaticus]